MRGYVLEELLAYLIRNTGYRLLVDAAQDPIELENRVNGLVVRGRGGKHQVDVLGQLAWIPAFTFPLRLIVEAKARGERCGLGVVRNSVGVLTDVNQNYTTGVGQRALQPRYAYHYAVFSTSGFTNPAADYAFAHQISLVDLSGPSFEDLRDVADEFAEGLISESPRSSRGGLIRGIRAVLRDALGTWPSDVPLPDESEALIGDERARIETFRRRAAGIGELFVGMANGPYLVVLRADDPVGLVRALDENPVRRVSIHWRPGPSQTEWVMRTNDREGDQELAFGLPGPIADWVFADGADAYRRAADVKSDLLSDITIYRHVDGRDRLYRLRFSPEQTLSEVVRARDTPKAR